MADPNVTLDFSTAQPIAPVQPSSSDTGVTLDFSTAQPIQQTNNNKPQQQPEATIGAVPQPKNAMERVERWADNVSYDLKHGTDLTGIGYVLKKMGAHGVYNGNPEAVGDFMASLPLGLLRATKGTAELPQSGKRWQGTKDVVGGVLDASTIPGSFVAPEASPLSKEGLLNDAANVAGKGIDTVSQAASKTAQAVKNAYRSKVDPQSLQPVLQSGVREVLSNVAEENGVAKPTAASIRDVAKQVGDAIYSKSKSLYAQLDAATGGKFQRFEDALSNINNKLRDIAGIDDAKEADLLKQKAEYESAQEQVFKEAQQKGVDPKLVDEAKGNWKKAHALYDADYNVKKATEGMRPNIGDAKQAAKNPETVNPQKFFNRVNNLYDSGRLHEAVGEQGANELLEHGNNALIRHKQILRNQNVARVVGKGTGYALAGSAGGAVVKHLID